MSILRTMLSQEREKRLEQLEREKHMIEKALLLRRLKGSVVWEKVSCGKHCCKKCGGINRVHGPYPYLHFYDASCEWKVRKRYLGKSFDLTLLTCPKTELEERLQQIQAEEREILRTTKRKGVKL